MRYLLCCAALAGTALAQTSVQMVFSLEKPAPPASRAFPNFHPAALLQFEPGLSSQAWPRLLRQSLEVILGDADGNGAFDDAPGNVDALTWMPGSASRSVYDLVVSFAAATTRLPAGVVRDGDLVRFRPDGTFQVVVAEGTLASVAGTGPMDIDAAAFLPTGELVFSFADKETTTNPALIQQNGNDPVLPDETILGWFPGTNRIRIVYTQAAVLSAVATALGKSVSTVVDVVGLAPDPMNPGHLLFTVASKAKGLVGAVFTTAGGGAYASLNNQILNGANAWGLAQATTLDALTLLPAESDLPTLFAVPETVTADPRASVTIQVRGAVPGGTLQLFASYGMRPVPRPFGVTPPLGPIGLAYLTPGDPLFLASAMYPGFRLTVDSQGHARGTFPLGYHAAGVSFLLQGVDLSTRAVTQPIAVDVVQP